MRGVGAKINGFFPRGIRDAALQFLLFFVAYNGYQLVRGLTDGSTTAAFVHAEGVIDIERGLGAFFEPGLQQALLQHASWLVDFSNFMYLNSHFVVTTGFLAWLYVARNEHFNFVRNMFLIAMGVALIGYAVFPTAPPRMFPGFGFTDTIAAFTGVPQDSQTADVLLNQYAAVPSMHIAFSLMVAVPAAALARTQAIRLAWSLYPALVFLAIIVTANHFWFDAAVGAAVACVAAVAARQLARLRPAFWAWPEETGERVPA